MSPHPSPTPAVPGDDSPARVPSCVAGWTARLRDAEIPVLAETAACVEELRTQEDDVDAHRIGEAIGDDPLMCLKVMAYAAGHRPACLVTDTESVTTTLVMMGIGPFFRAFGPQPTVEATLADHPQALEGLSDVLRRGRRAARFALAFAVHRMEPDHAVIHQAALLHDFAEMLLWCHAPEFALRIRAALRADRTLRSAQAQRDVLGCDLPTLQQALMKTWRLPDLLVQIVDPQLPDRSDVRTVTLAVRLARHLESAQGWHNAALHDDTADIARLLNLAPGATLKLLRAVDA
jgi:HD-like signal output (HDOD) protein